MSYHLHKDVRRTFATIIEEIANEDESIICITGDLGYNAFESLQNTLGSRFINAGVAEQSMMSMAAGIAYKGFKVFCYRGLMWRHSVIRIITLLFFITLGKSSD